MECTNKPLITCKLINYQSKLPCFGFSPRLAGNGYSNEMFSPITQVSVEMLRDSSTAAYKPGACCQPHSVHNCEGFLMQPPVPWQCQTRQPSRCLCRVYPGISDQALIVIFSSGPRAKQYFRNSRFSEWLSTLV